MKKRFLILCILLLLAACSLPQSPATSATLPPGASILPTNETPTFTPSVTITPTDTITITPTSTYTATFTALPSDTPTQTSTPTQQSATAVSKANSSCQYGPNKAYLYMYGLTPGASAAIQGRDAAGDWLWVQPTGTKLFCWVFASLVTTSIDVKSIPVENPPLPTNPSVRPPSGVHAARSGDSVTVSWNAAAPAVELAYLIEASICSNGLVLGVVTTTSNTSLTLTDGATCKYASSGQLRVQNKLGYSTAVKISWP